MRILIAILYALAVLSSNDWENRTILQVNRLPARASFQSEPVRVVSLNGTWKFRYFPTVREAGTGFPLIQTWKAEATDPN